MNALIDYLRSLREYVKYLRNWRLCIPFLFLYLETVFHLYMKLDMKYIPVFLLLSAAAVSFFYTGKGGRDQWRGSDSVPVYTLYCRMYL